MRMTGKWTEAHIQWVKNCLDDSHLFTKSGRARVSRIRRGFEKKFGCTVSRQSMGSFVRHVRFGEYPSEKIRRGKNDGRSNKSKAMRKVWRERRDGKREQPDFSHTPVPMGEMTLSQLETRVNTLLVGIEAIRSFAK